MRETNVTKRVRSVAKTWPPLALAARLRAAAAAHLKRSGRWLLPFFFAAWGCAVQGGQLKLLRDAPRVLVYLLPLKWGQLVPEPSDVVVKRTKRAYAKANRAVKSALGGGAKRVAKAVGVAKT
jgi:hypothetical protein